MCWLVICSSDGTAASGKFNGMNVATKLRPRLLSVNQGWLTTRWWLRLVINYYRAPCERAESVETLSRPKCCQVQLWQPFFYATTWWEYCFNELSGSVLQYLVAKLFNSEDRPFVSFGTCEIQGECREILRMSTQTVILVLLWPIEKGSPSDAPVTRMCRMNGIWEND
jgi:hypothetical protein